MADVGSPDVGKILRDAEEGGVELLDDLPPDRLAPSDAGSGRGSGAGLMPYTAYRRTGGRSSGSR